MCRPSCWKVPTDTQALTLLEYLIKHGSERVVDDARAHLSTVKMLRNFHYTDDKGKDQGINGKYLWLGRMLTSVRNRANEIASLLGDVDKIRQERRKAVANRNKYRGVEGGLSNTASGSRYGGFGSDSYSGGSSRPSGRDTYSSRDDDYRGSGSGRASSSGAFRDTSSRQPEYDEYEGADDFDERPPRSASANASRSGRSSAPPKPPKEQPKAKQPEVNLFDFDDDEPVAAPAAAPAAAAPVDAFGDDDFDDFQQAPANAPSAPSAPAAPSPSAPTGGNANLFALLESSKPSSAAAPSAPSQPSLGGMGNMGGMGTMGRASTGGMGMGGMGSMGSMGARPAATSPAPAGQAAKPKPAASAFDDLWTTSLGTPALAPSPAGGKKTIAEMGKEKAQSSLWGQPSAPSAAKPAAPAKPAASGGGFDDLLL